MMTKLNMHPASLKPWHAFIALIPFAVAACDEALVIRVSTTTDGGEGSLRAAIDAANLSVLPVTIELPTGIYELTLCGRDDDNVAGDLDITTNAKVSLVARGPAVTIRQTCTGDRVLDAKGAGLLTVSGLTVTGGSLVAEASDAPAQGGGVRASADVELNGAVITANSATGAPAALVEGAPAVDPAAYGGGLYVAGSLVAVGSTISSNSAHAGPNAYGLPAGAAEGGGAYVAQAVASVDGAFSENVAFGRTSRGGGLAQRSSSVAPIELKGTSFTLNEVRDGGEATGGALATAGALNAEGITAIDNSARGAPARGGALATLGPAVVSSSTFLRNRVGAGGGSFVCMGMCGTLCMTTPFAPATGGAVWASGDLTLNSGTYSENSATHGSLTCYPAEVGRCGPIGERCPTASNTDRGGAVAAQGKLVVAGGQFVSNRVFVGQGGAISSVGDASIAGARIQLGASAGGAAVSVDSRLTISDTEVEGNYGSGISAGVLEGSGLSIRNHLLRGIDSGSACASSPAKTLKCGC